MLNISLAEILLIMVIFLVVVGPEQIPKVARTAGQLMRKVRQATNFVRDILEQDLQDSSGRGPLDQQKTTLDRHNRRPSRGKPSGQRSRRPRYSIQMLSPSSHNLESANLPGRSSSIGQPKTSAKLTARRLDR